jgi:hypothetical protein
MQPPPQRIVEPSGLIFDHISEGGNQGIALGWRFTTDVSGWIVQAGWQQSSADLDSHAAYLISPAHEIMRVAAWVPHAVGGPEAPYSWVRRNIKPGWFIEPGNVYEFLVWRHITDYAYIHNQLDSAPLVAGHLTILQNNFDGVSSAGLFKYDWPFNTDLQRGEGTLYGVDLAFQPSAD